MNNYFSQDNSIKAGPCKTNNVDYFYLFSFEFEWSLSKQSKKANPRNFTILYAHDGENKNSRSVRSECNSLHHPWIFLSEIFLHFFVATIDWIIVIMYAALFSFIFASHIQPFSDFFVRFVWQTSLAKGKNCGSAIVLLPGMTPWVNLNDTDRNRTQRLLTISSRSLANSLSR